MIYGVMVRGVVCRVHAGHPAPFRGSAFRIPPDLVVSDHLAPFARLWTALPPSLVRRYSHDYYEATVAIGLNAP